MPDILSQKNNLFKKFCIEIEKNIQYSDFLKKNCLNTDKKLLKFSGLTKTSSSLIALLTYFHLKNQTKKKSLLYIIDDKIDPYVIKLEIQSFLQLYGINEEVEILELPSKISGDRLLFFEKLLLASKNPKIVIVNSNSLLETTISKLKLESDKFDLKVGDIFEREKLIEKFVEFGFARQEEVYEKQDFSVRGEILDIWALDAENPIRIIFDDNKIEAIYEFDAMTQRRKNKLESNKITLRNFTESSDTIILDYFDKNDFIAFFEEKDIENTKNFLNDKEFVSITIEPFARDSVDLKLYETITFNGNLDFLYKYFEELESNNFSVCVVLYKDSEIQSFKAMLSKKFPKLKINYFSGFLRQGFCSLEKNFIIFTEKELFGRDLIAEFNFSKKEQKKYKNRTKKFENLEGKNLDVFKETSIDYKIGDYVVHNNFGIGRFLGFTQVNTNDKVSEYITIEYAKGDKLFVPIFDFNLISKYSNYESDYVPLLDSMDSFTWQKTRKKVEQKIFEMAMEIISIQATRKKIKGFIFKESKLAEIEFSNTFPYDETEDQKVAIQEVLADMASENPMERLLCGDVGYGKTEVAIRATFRAIMNYKQVVLVCPTTILAKQHFNTFKTRFLNYPVKVVMLSRFLTQKEIAVNKKFIEEGKADIIISTHSVLRSNIKFKNLGFLIVDEEHRFGVKDKEKLKRLQKNLDILYLSATPIPRTLSMALNGIKDISVIETPPPIRKNITTNITEYDEKLIKQMIDFELARNGQVFFVYNRIENIMEKAIEISKLVPKAKIAVVHGRMSTDDLDKIMMDFIDKKYNVLITTTIIESGLDIPAVNMIIVDRVDKLGLSQIYQLRGRVGRGYEKAFCYLLYPKNYALNENAIKRLRAIQSFQGFGAGIKLAMRDLEIRGAGNILGKKQHGYIKEIGFELYMDMLNKALSSINSENLDEIDTEIDLDINFYIPNIYIESPPIRMYFYKRLLSISSKNELDNIKLELFDRFGKIPLVLENFFDICEIRFIAKKLKILSIKENKKTISINFLSSTNVNFDKLLNFIQKYKNNLKFRANNTNIIEILNLPEDKEKKLNFIKNFLENISV